MKEFWDKRYSEQGFAYGKEPNAFLVQQAGRISNGSVLCLAEGEGRNAAYLASLGHYVTTVDQSKKGLEKTRLLAGEKGVTVTTILADLNDFIIKPDTWTGIVSISGHLPPALRRKVHQQAVKGLKKGGLFILEAYTEKQLVMEGHGGPHKEHKEMFMDLASLKIDLSGLEFIVARETTRIFNEGAYHQGPSSVVQIVAQKLF